MLRLLKSQNKTFIKFTIFLVTVFGLVFNAPSIHAQFNTDYDTTKSEIDASISRIDQSIAKINVDLENSSTLKNTLEEQKIAIEAEIQDTEDIIVDSKLLINQIQSQIDINQEEYDELVVQMKTIFFDLEREARVPLFLRVLSSENLVDALSKSYSYTNLQSKANSLRVELETTKKELENNKSKQEERQEQLEQASFLLKSKKSGLDDLLNTYRNREDEYKALVASLREQRRVQEAQANTFGDGISNPAASGERVAAGASCYFEDPTPLDIPKDYLGSPATGAISRVFAGCTHDAADIANSIGTPLRAIANGTIHKKGFAAGGYGNYVFVKHTLPSGQRIYALYGHMNSQSFLNTGDVVSKGATIGYMGNTGYSTGPHVHFAIFSQTFEQNGGNEGCRNGGRTRTLCYDPSKYITLGR
ncbi:MAG: peptidoglycan DD-metalloendopeptidase family protein [Patescibacteria group bacterium]